MLLCLGGEVVTRFWFYRPQWYWHGWSTLLPIYRGHDEFARWTLVVGWTITGRVVIALGGCGNPECEADALTWITPTPEVIEPKP